MKIGTITFNGEVLTVDRSTYPHGGATAITLLTPGHPDGDMYGVLSVNLPDTPLPVDCFCAKTWSENKGLAEVALASGLFEDTGRRVPTGFVEAQIWRVKGQQ